MEEYEQSYSDDDDGAQDMIGALRRMGSEGVNGATFSPFAATAPGTAASANSNASAAPGNARSAAADAEADVEADLGDDIVAIRNRAKAAQMRAASARAHAHSNQEQYERLKKLHQVDLNDEEQLKDLEDAGLVKHMKAARQRLADHERRQSELPLPMNLDRDDKAARRALSTLMKALKEQQMALQVACDDTIQQGKNAAKLAVGDQPHGFPAATEPPGKAFDMLGKKVGGIGAELGLIVTALEDFERELTLARRSYETVVDGLTRWKEHFQEAYQEAVAAAEPRASPGEGPGPGRREK